MLQKLEPADSCLSCGSREPLFLQHSRAQMHTVPDGFSFVRCQNCGLIFLSPRVTAEALKDYYPDHYLPYRREQAWGRFAGLIRSGFEQLDRERLRVAGNYAALSEKTKVLDVGCGYPSFLKALQDKWGCQCWGIDFAAEQWKEDPAFRGITLLNQDVRQLELNEPFGLITMWHYLEHDYDPLATLRKLRQLAHPETVLLIEVPNYDSWSRKVFGSCWAGYHTPRHTAVYTPQTLSALLENAGWQVEAGGLSGTLGGYLLWWLSWREKWPTRWDSTLERFLPEFLLGQLLLSPLLWLNRSTPDIQLAVARPS